ncbi:unnamed protein product [Orchesella dallaii]|uniref:Uncharacterized protein n=1 Tax=Orchesella dallaii TaxID=48710 RepID=A0ABP1QA12_9HEXA
MANSTTFGNKEWVWLIGSEVEAMRFNVKATLRTQDNLSVTQWQGPVHSIRKTAKEITDSGMVFVTNCKDVTNPFMFKKEEHTNRNFWLTDVEIIEIQPPSPESFLYIVTTGETLEFHASVNMGNENPKKNENLTSEDATSEQVSDADENINEKDLQPLLYPKTEEVSDMIENNGITSDHSSKQELNKAEIIDSHSSAIMTNENPNSDENVARRDVSSRETPLTQTSDDVSNEKVLQQMEMGYGTSQPVSKSGLSSNVPKPNGTAMSIITIEYQQTVREVPTPSMLRAILIPAETIHTHSPNAFSSSTTGRAHSNKVPSIELESTLDLDSDLTVINEDDEDETPHKK